MTIEPTRDHLGSFPADLFDCIQVNLAVVADRVHGWGTGLRLGAWLRFRPMPGPTGLPTVEPPPTQQIRDSAPVLGLRVSTSDEPADPAAFTPGLQCLVVGDAHALPWVPYFGHCHVPHSFLVENQVGDEITVSDAYHNDTPWGAARPGQWTLKRAEFDDLPRPIVLARFEGTSLPVATPVSDPADSDRIDSYVAAYAEHPDREAALEQLALETWLLTRARKLHLAFREHAGLPLAGGAEHVRAWESVTEQVYLAHRRVQRGRAEPAGPLPLVAELLRRDAVVFAPTAVSADRLRGMVAEIVGDILDVTPHRLLAHGSFAEVPSFSSFRIAEIVELLEFRLGFEFDPDALVPENLHDVDTLTRVVAESMRRHALTTAVAEVAL